MASPRVTNSAAAATTAAPTAWPTASLVPAQWADSVRTLGMGECREAALALAHAFAADGVSQYLVSADAAAAAAAAADGPAEEEATWRLHVDMMAYVVAAAVLNGVVTTVGADYEAVALWMPPGRDLDGWWTALRSGLWRLRFQLPAEGRRRYYAEVQPLLRAAKLEVMAQRGAADDSYYLLYLGTKPGARRRGYAQKLLEHLFARADAEHRPVYLESSSLANNAYYRKFGFELKRDVVLRRAPRPVGLSIMVREPQPPPPPLGDKLAAAGEDGSSCGPLFG